MSKKVINLRDKNDYNNRLKETFEFLEKVENDLVTEMINLAISGKWKKWSDEQPIGTEFSFTDEILKDTGDENINILCDLREELIKITERLTKANNV
jgi:hypothetical protein